MAVSTSNVMSILQTTNENVSKGTVVSNITDEERKRYLDLLQEETTRYLIPTIVFLSIIAIVGLFGNSMVLLVYSRKPRRNATDIFIMAIASVDLTANVLALPGEIYDTFHYWDFDKPAICKIRLYINAFTTITSALTLLAVAVVRYKMVCKPFGRQTSVKTAKTVSLFIALLTSLFTVPQAILNGSQTAPSPRSDVVGKTCTIDDGYKDTMWPFVYNSFLMLLFLGSCIPLIVLYIPVGIQAWRHSKRHGILVPSKSVNNSVSKGDDSNKNSQRKPQTKHGLKFLRKKEGCLVESGKNTSFEVITCRGVGTKKSKTDIIDSDITTSKERTNSTSEVDMSSLCTYESKTDFPMLQDPSTKTYISNEHSKTDEASSGDLAVENVTPEGVNQMSPFVKTLQERKPSNRHESETECSHKDNSNHIMQCDLAPSTNWVGTANLEEDEKKTENQDNSNDNENDLSTPRSRSCLKFSDLLNKTLQVTEKSNAQVTTAKKDEDNYSSAAALTMGDEFNGLSDGQGNHASITPKSDSAHHPLPRSDSQRKSNWSKTNEDPKILNRTTIMLIIISAIYIIVFVPYLTLSACKLAVPNFLENMNVLDNAFYNIFLRFYFINSCANAIIYGLCDARFRTEALKIVSCRQ